MSDQTTVTLPDDVMQGFRKLLEKQAGGDLQRAAEILYDERHTQRQRIRELEAAAKTAKTPEGSLVLTKDEAKLWEAYQGHGTPAEIKKKMEAGTDAETRLTALEREAGHRRVAGEVGWNADAFWGLTAEKADLSFEVRTEGDADEAAKVLYVKEGEEAAKKGAEYFSTFLPALQVEAEKRPPPTAPHQPPRARPRPKDNAEAVDRDIQERFPTLGI